MRSNDWDNDTAALQLFSHLEGDALNVAHLVRSNTDVNADVNTDLPENSAPMMNLDLRFWQSDAQLCPPVAYTLDRRPMEGISGRLLVNSPGLALAPDSRYVKDPPHPRPLEQGALGVNRKSDNLDSCDEPQSGRVGCQAMMMTA